MLRSEVKRSILQGLSSASAAAGLSIGILLDSGDFAVRISHELLELILKRGLDSGLRRLCVSSGLTGGGAVAAAGIIVGVLIECSALGRLGRGLLRLFDRKIYATIFINADYFYLYFLTFLEKLADLIYVRISDLRNMYQAGFSSGQGNKGTELHYAGYLAVHYGSHNQIHVRP